METRLEELKTFLRGLVGGGAALAFSGGVDSSLLLAVLAGMLAEKPFGFAALAMDSEFQRPGEIAAARRFAVRCNIDLKVIHFAPLELPELRSNPPERCYFCKHAFFGRFREFADRNRLNVLLDGTNADDLAVYRPGLKALHEYGVISPLAELGIGKNEIRTMAEELKLDCAHKPSTPCLATRFDYGENLTAAALEAVGRGEDLLRRFLPENSNLRLRSNGRTARIEVSPEVMPNVLAGRKKIVSELKELGFKYITLDLNGFHSGGFDADKKLNEPNRG